MSNEIRFTARHTPPGGYTVINDTTLLTTLGDGLSPVQERKVYEEAARLMARVRERIEAFVETVKAEAVEGDADGLDK